MNCLVGLDWTVLDWIGLDWIWICIGLDLDWELDLSWRALDWSGLEAVNDMKFP